jgi:hypothetical protein
MPNAPSPMPHLPSPTPNAQYFDLPRLRSARVAQYKCPMPNLTLDESQIQLH